MNRLSEPGDLLATETGGSPNVLYFADRRGWLLDRNYNLKGLEWLSRSGAHYYGDAFYADAQEQRPFFNDLAGRFARLTSEDAPWQIYDLAVTSGPVNEFPAREIQFSSAVNFADQIQFRGVSLRRLLESPATFEVTYYWQCLETPPTDVRVFVHATNSAGRTCYQQDHWPQSGRFPTSRWKSGDFVSERYVLVFPATLPLRESTELRLGWFDPVRGLRLPVLDSNVENSDDSVVAAELEIHRQN